MGINAIQAYVTAFGYGKYWHDQILLETATLAESGLPILGYTMFPVIDTFGWQCALSCHGGDVGVDTGGISELSGMMRPYVESFLAPLRSWMKQDRRSHH